MSNKIKCLIFGWAPLSSLALSFLVALASQQVFSQEIVDISDNADADIEYRGNWVSSNSYQNFYGTDYRVLRTGDEKDYFRFQLEVPVDGFYRVRIRWSKGSARSQNVQALVRSEYGNRSITLDQQDDAGNKDDPASWYDAGVYYFLAGGVASVDLKADGDNLVIADGVALETVTDSRYQFLGSSSSDTLRSGGWVVENGAEGSFEVAQAGDGSSTFDWLLNVPQQGQYDLFMIAEKIGSMTNALPVYITQQGTTPQSAIVNQRNNADRMVHVGRFNLDAGAVTVSINNDNNRPVVADRILLAPVRTDLRETVFDDKSVMAERKGAWVDALGGKSSFAEGYSKSFGDSAANTWFKWKLNPVVDGYYDVYVRWKSKAQNTSSALYRVTHSNGEDTVEVDQTTGGDWVLLGSYLLQGRKAPQIMLEPGGSGALAADAVKISFKGRLLSGWAIQNITNTPTKTESVAMINGDNIVWLRGGRIELFDKDFKITTLYQKGPGETAFAPNMHGEKVVWRVYDGVSTQYIYMWDGQQVNLIDSYVNEGPPFVVDPFRGYPPTNHCLDPTIFENKVAYPKWDGNDYELYVWEDGNVVQITSDETGMNDLEPAISGDYIAFIQWPIDDSQQHYIALYDGNSTIRLADGATDPHTDGTNVVYSDWNDEVNGRQYDVIRWRDGVYTNMSDIDGTDFEPQVSGNLISWAGINQENGSRDVFINDNGKVIPLANSPLKEHISWSYGNKVVFGVNDGNTYDVYLATKIQ